MPAAGTVVTLMKTPTMVAVFSMASARTPAAPATSATTNDHMSGCQMKPVFGRGRVIISASSAPVRLTSQASTATTATANAKLKTSSCRLRPASPHRANTIPTDTRRDRAELRPHDHRPDHQDRGVGDDGDRGEDDGEHEEDDVRHGGLGAVVGLGLHRLPDDRVVGVAGREGLEAGRLRERGRERGGEDDAAALVEPELVELVQDHARLLARHVALDQVALGVDADPALDGDVGDALPVHEQVAHPVREVVGHGETEVDQHGHSVRPIPISLGPGGVLRSGWPT